MEVQYKNAESVLNGVSLVAEGVYTTIPLLVLKWTAFSSQGIYSKVAQLLLMCVLARAYLTRNTFLYLKH
jgi:hypothetical protein